MYPQIFRNLAHGQDLRRNGRLFLTFDWLTYFSFERHRFGVFYTEKARVARAISSSGRRYSDSNRTLPTQTFLTKFFSGVGGFVGNFPNRVSIFGLSRF
jgi:hypothetical protein